MTYLSLKYKYGITYDTYVAMSEAQDNKCAICGAISDSLCVDHDHKTAKIRGLLCNRCNTALRMLGDDIETIRKAEEYLMKPS